MKDLRKAAAWVRGAMGVRGGVLLGGWFSRLAGWAVVSAAGAAGAERPNILWITCEDMSPNLGCYGDVQAKTPNIDRLAGEGVRYTRAFATAPACSPSRSCLITGVYATTLGTPHLRSGFPTPARVEGFPTYLRRAGYYCSNNVKTDYNTSREKEIVAASWDECSGKAHWRNRREGQPFFAVFNFLGTHQAPTTIESDEAAEKRLSKLPAAMRHDPAAVAVPPYYPDTPQVRRTLARYADNISLLDQEHVGVLLKQLADDGLAGDTVVFFYSDHGAGMPRHKRLALDTGLRVPLIVRVPERHRALAPGAAGSAVDRFVSFLDFAPTVLNVAGLAVPEHMQGRAFLGKGVVDGPEFLVGARDRVDEAIDTVRCVRDGRYLYARNFYPHISHAAPEGFSDQAPMRQEIVRMAREGRLNAAQMTYAAPTRAIEELYDVEADPFLIGNLADSREHRDVLERMRVRLKGWVRETRDLGFVPESDLWSRIGGATPYELASAGHVPVERIFAAADLVGRPGTREEQMALLRDGDAAVRYWAVVGLRAGGGAAADVRRALEDALGDASAAVRIEAAGALIALGGNGKAFEVIGRELAEGRPDAAVHAARTLQLLGDKARPALARMEEAFSAASGKASRYPKEQGMYLRFALRPAIEALGGAAGPGPKGAARGKR